MKTVLLLESVAPAAHRLLAENSQLVVADDPANGLAYAREQPVHAIVTRGKGRVDRALIDHCDGLEVIARCGVGLDNVDVAAASERGVAVTNAPGSNAATVAEHTLGLMLSLVRRLPHSFRAVREGNWQYRLGYDGDEIRRKRLGIIGMGDIGQRVAVLATAFGMEVAYHNRSAVDVPYPIRPLNTLLETADLVSLHLPLTEETRGMIDAATLARLPAGAFLINTSRGEIIDQQALYDALSNGRLAGFAADVLATEPPAPDDPLLQLPNVLVSPHTASLTALTFDEMCVLTVRNALQLLQGQTIHPKYYFNP